MAVAEPRLTDYIIGTMKLTRREGDYDAFLALRGVPYPVRLVLQNLVGSTRRWASEMKHGVLWLTETELGTFSDTAKAPVPLDGAARAVLARYPPRGGGRIRGDRRANRVESANRRVRPGGGVFARARARGRRRGSRERQGRVVFHRREQLLPLAA